MKLSFVSVFLGALALPLFVAASATISITEIMYAPEGADAGREWIELYNGGGAAVDLTGWKFSEGGVNHGLVLSQGVASVPAGGYAIVADNPAKFLEDFPSYSGTLFDSSFSLGNDGELLDIKDTTLAIVESVAYESAWGAKDDGMSLQRTGGSFSAAAPTPGTGSGTAAAPAPEDAGETSSGVPAATNQSAASWPVEPQIFASAGPDRIALVGADVLFDAKAWGIEKKPLENARYIWNFGDGATKEGKAVSHAYRYPGDYIVVLDVASGYYSATDRAKVQAENSKISITSIDTSGNRFVELSNGSNYEIDISGWMLREGSNLFTIPANSFISGGKKVTFPYEVTLIPNGPNVELLYPNGSVADAYVPGRTTTVVSKQATPARNPAIPPLVVEKAVLTPSAQAASVAAASAEEDSEGSMPGVYKWLLAVLALAGVAGAGVVFLPKHTSVSGVSGTALTPADFTITEKTD